MQIKIINGKWTVNEKQLKDLTPKEARQLNDFFNYMSLYNYKEVKQVLDKTEQIAKTCFFVCAGLLALFIIYAYTIN